MKSTFLSMFMLMLCLNLSAQTQKGRLLIGGTFGSSQIDLDRGDWTLLITPKAQYFLADRLSVGGGLVASYWSGPNGLRLGLSPEFRYYFYELPNVKFFGNALSGYSHLFKSGSYLSSDFFNLGMGLGTNIMFNNRIALELGLQYNHDFSSGAYYSRNTLNFQIGVVGFLGKD